MSKTADFSETAVRLLVIRVRGTHLVASDLSWDLMLVSSHLCLSTIGRRIFGFSCLGLSCLIAFFRLSSDAGLALVSTSPCQESSQKQPLKTPDVSAKRSRAFFTSLNLSLLLQASGKMDRQWLCSLNPVLSEDSPNPGEQSVARPTEAARFLRSTWVVSG